MENFALKSAAMQFCWVAEHLYDEQTSIGVIAVTQGCCDPVLHNSIEQWRLYFALKSAALHWRWVRVFHHEACYPKQNKLGICIYTKQHYCV